MRTYLFNTEKFRYVRGDKPSVDCILCAIRDHNPDVESLIIAETDYSIITLNLYPYNPGHLMIFPRRHVAALAELGDDEALDIHHQSVRAVQVLDAVYAPHGYNAGYNIGQPAGGSIAHLHLHIVPRYANEAGFIDVLSGERIFIEDPRVTLEKLVSAFSRL
jgi:ATP adenylyltransferase